MAGDPSDLELLHELQTEADAVGRLLASKGAFEAAFEAFRSEDSKAFQSVIERAGLQIRCHYVCHWIRIKECVFLCLDLAGPPTQFERPPDPRVLATALGRLAADEKLVKRLADVLVKRDRKGFLDIVKRLEIQPYAHLFCHWLCTIRYRLVCRWICTIGPQRPPVLWEEIRAAALALGALAEDSRTFKAVAAASVAGDFAKLAELLRHPDWTWRCHFVCEYFCSWRCVLLCLLYARPFPFVAIEAAAQIREARAFAETIAKLSADLPALERLAEAVGTGKVDRWTSLIKEYKLERFALQLCHWVCGWRCYLYCRLVCPPPGIIPIFDHVGVYRVDPFFNDFTASGTTTAGGYAFTGTIPLIGLLPPSPVANPIEYRFTVKKLPGGAVVPLTLAEIGGSVIGSLEFWEWDATALPAPGQWKLRTTDYTIDNAAAFHTIQQPVGSLSVQVTTPIALDGWVRVPTDDDLTQGGGGKFVATHLLANLDTTKLTLEQFDLHGPGAGLPIVAGAPVPAGPPAANNKRSEKPVFQINFEARKSVGPVPISSNSLPKIALSNTHYAFDRHPDWAGSTITLADKYPQALLLDIMELRTIGGCSPLTTTMTAEFTAYHPYLASCHLYLEGPAPALPATLPDVNPAIDAAGQATSTPAGMVFNISGLRPCAYILWIKTTLNLTSGYGAIGGVYDDHIAFCVH